ncbi:MAG: murein biosynthesis integral membrane protein MurJ [Chloroflexi bacterium RBG_16_63_12]|nr:MAG: murein biosynthesis integral membrane protein MurJ [Chloroflexi bacterium RBG_16_63_12]
MSYRLVRTSLLVGAFFGLDKIVALGRQVILARYFGLDPVLDAYNASNNLPDTLFALISGGALAIAFIPVLTETLDREGRAGAWKLFSLVANLAFVVTALGAALIALFPLVLARRVVTPGFSLEQQLLVADLMRLNLIATLIFSISGLVMGALQANQHFFLPALAPVFYNIGQIVGVILLKPAFGIHGLAYGVILGAALHLAIQVPGLVRYQFKWTPRLTLADDGVRRVLRLMGPRILTLGFINLVFIANDNLASRLGTNGAISALAYGWLILQLPETVIGTAVGTALLPTLSKYVSRGEHAELKRLLRRAIAILLAVTIPVALASLVLVRPAVKLVFEGRAFTAENSELVILAARMFLLGLAGHSLVEIAARTFYAHQDARTPLFLAALTLSLYIVFGTALTPQLNFAGLALANSLAFTTEAIVMLFILHRRNIL